MLDLCAAPGSKTGQLSIHGRARGGEVTAVEKVRPRFYKLKANVYAQGATNVLPWLGNGAAYWRREPESFDRVLVDAPCSSEGRFRTHDPETMAVLELAQGRAKCARSSRSCSGPASRPSSLAARSSTRPAHLPPRRTRASSRRALRTFGDAIEVEVEANLPSTGPVAEQAVPALGAWNGREFPEPVRKARRVLPNGLLEGFFLARIAKHASTVDAALTNGAAE